MGFFVCMHNTATTRGQYLALRARLDSRVPRIKMPYEAQLEFVRQA